MQRGNFEAHLAIDIFAYAIHLLRLLLLLLLLLLPSGPGSRVLLLLLRELLRVVLIVLIRTVVRSGCGGRCCCGSWGTRRLRWRRSWLGSSCGRSRPSSWGTTATAATAAAPSTTTNSATGPHRGLANRACSAAALGSPVAVF